MKNLKKYQSGAPVKPLPLGNTQGDIMNLPGVLNYKDLALKDAASKLRLQEENYKKEQSRPVIKQGKKRTSQDEANRIKLNQQYADSHGGYLDNNGNYVQGVLNNAADSRLANNAWDNVVVPLTEAEMIMSGAGVVGKGVQQGIKQLPKLINYLTKENVSTNTKFALPTLDKLKNVLLESFPEYNYKNLNVNKTGNDWMKEWYSNPNIKQKIKNWEEFNKPKDYINTNNIRNYFIKSPDEVDYNIKNYYDLFKDKGLKEYLKHFLTTDGVNYSNDLSTSYVRNFGFKPFNNIGKESTIVHEMTHGLTTNGIAFNNKEKDALLKPFGMTDKERINLFGDNKGKPGLTQDSKKSYYLDPTEIHARINESRYLEGLKPGEEFTKEMYNRQFKKNKFNGMGRYITDHKSLLDLFNNFYTPSAALTGIGTSTLLNNYDDMSPKYKQGGNISMTGYLSDSPDRFNFYNIIPSNILTMQGVPHDVLAIADNGKTKIMKKNSGLHKFTGANTVLEVPLLQNGGSIVNYLESKNQNSSFNSRKELAKRYGINNYKGTSEQNLQLLDYLESKFKNNKMNTPNNVNPKPKNTSKISKTLPNKKVTIDERNLISKMFGLFEDKVTNFDIPEDVYDFYQKNLENNKGKKFGIVSKNNAKAYFFDEKGKLVIQDEVGLGKDKGEEQPIFYKVMTTPSGEYIMSKPSFVAPLADKMKKAFEANNFFFLDNKDIKKKLKDPEGKKIGARQAMHGIPKHLLNQRLPLFDNNNVDDNNMSAGCINCKKQFLDNPYFSNWNTGNVYVTPENYIKKYGGNINEFNLPHEIMLQMGGMINAEHLYQMQNGGRPPIITNNPNDPRLKAYNDSLSLYKMTQSNLISRGWGKYFTPREIETQFQKYSPYEIGHMKASPTASEWYARDTENNSPTGTGESSNSFEGFKNKVNPKILPVGRYIITSGDNRADIIPKYKKPVQPVIYQKDKPFVKPSNGKIATNEKDLSYDIPLPDMRFSDVTLAKEKPTDYMVNWRDDSRPNGQQNQTKYFNTLDEWRQFIEKNNIIDSNESGDGKKAGATLQGLPKMQLGGIDWGYINNAVNSLKQPTTLPINQTFLQNNNEYDDSFYDNTPSVNQMIAQRGIDNSQRGIITQKQANSITKPSKKTDGITLASTILGAMNTFSNQIQDIPDYRLYNQNVNRGTSDAQFATINPTLSRGFTDINSGKQAPNKRTINQFTNAPINEFYGTPIAQDGMSFGISPNMVNPLISNNLINFIPLSNDNQNDNFNTSVKETFISENSPKTEDFFTYMMHQQGQGGIKAIKKSAETGEHWSKFYKGPEDLDKNMAANITKSEFYKKYDVLNTANFLDYWKNKFDRKYKTYSKKQTPYDNIITEIAKQKGVNPMLAKVVAGIESDFNPNNKTGSYKGLYQLSEKEMKKMGFNNPYDPIQNIQAGIDLLAKNKKTVSKNLFKEGGQYTMSDKEIEELKSLGYELEIM